MDAMTDKHTPAPDEPQTATVDPEQAEDEFFVEPPQFEVEYKGDCAYEVKVSVPPANQSKQAEEMFDELKSEAEVPGFRRGKAPRKLLEKKFSKAVRSEVAAKIVNAAFEKLVKDEDFKPIGAPDIDGLEEIDQLPDDQPLDFTLKFEVAPRVELGKYRGVAIERPVVTVGDDDIQETLENMRSRFAVYETLNKGKAQKGDQVIIDFEGRIDGEAFEGGSAQNYPYILGSQRFFPEFEAVLLGAKPDSDLTCTVTFPADYFNQNLQGQTAEFTIHVNEIKRKTLPELDDSFATQAGFASADDLKAKVKEQLQQGASARSNQVAQARLLEEIVNTSTFELPKTMLERASRAYYDDEVKRLMEARVPVSEIRNRDEALHKQAADEAALDIKKMVALNEIGEAEGIEVTDEDFEREAANIGQRLGVAKEAVFSYLQQGEERGTVEDRIFRAKTLEHLMELATITDKEVPLDAPDETQASAEE
jgi:trigger factor